MPEIRKDFLTGQLVAISEERGERPIFYTRGETDTSREQCPFCPENRHMTPDDIYVSDNKRVRVFPNKYPALTDTPRAYGFHEVIIDTPVHSEKLKDFNAGDITTIFLAIQSRLDHHYKNPKIKYIQIIKNEGQNAGASIYHSHWQLFAMDFIPGMQETIRKNLYAYSQKANSCFLCDLINGKNTSKICEDEYFLAYSPYASTCPHMVNITSKSHIGSFRELDAAALTALSHIIKKVLSALDTIVCGLSYNICFQDMPYNEGHFFVQLIPRIGNLAGFELSTGCFINYVLPEKSSGMLKDIIAKANGKDYN